MAQDTFVTAINCMDGRTQLPVNSYLMKKYKVNHVDTITEPGPIKILAENSDIALIDSIKNRVDVSVNKHGSQLIAIVGHFDCAGNPVDKEKQLLQLDNSVKTVETWNFKAKIIKLWVDDNWSVTEV